MCVLCSEFSCRVGNNHQIQRREKKEEDELLAQQTFPFFTFFRCIIPSLLSRILMPSMDKMTFTWSSSQFQIYTTHAMLSSLYPSTHYNPQSLVKRKCPAIIFLTGQPFISGFLLTYHPSTLESMFLNKTQCLASLSWQHLRANLVYSLSYVP